MPDVAFGRGGWRAGAGDVMGIELLGKSFSCETLTECLLQGQEACWRWKWVVREAWVGWMVLVELEACGVRAVTEEAGHTGCGSALGAWWVGLGSSVPCLLQPSLLGAPAPSGRLGSDPGLSDSDSEESVFSGLEDSGSDSTEDATASEEEGAGTSEQRSRMDRSPGQQVGEPGVSRGLYAPQMTMAKIAPAGHRAL